MRITTGDYVNTEHMKRLTPLRSGKQLEKSEQEAEAGKAFAEVGPWLERQKDSVVQPRIRAVIEELHGKGKKIGRFAIKCSRSTRLLTMSPSLRATGIVGFCWGGRVRTAALCAWIPKLTIEAASYTRSRPTC